MKKPKRSRDRPESPPSSAAAPGRGRSRWWLAGLLVVMAGLGIAVGWPWLRSKSDRGPARPAGPLTFHRDIAPIVFTHCAGCHHPGSAAPFSLLTYGDVVKRAALIAEVTARRVMPPWLPEPGVGEFVGQRFLSSEQITRIETWVTQGAIEGDPKEEPPPPRWRDGWQLGEPDLIVKLPAPYLLAAEGKDVYRCFVLPIPLTAPRYVQAIEFLPGNAGVVHHAFMFIDPTRESRRRDEKDPEPGFPGMHAPPSVQTPAGHFLSWQPGKVATSNSADLSWRLEKNCDLIVQAHLRPSGKPEKVQPSVGFYFSDRPPTKTPFKFGLWTYRLDIPAGESNYLARESYVLPVDADVLRVLPHAHYLGRQLEGVARLPDGTQTRLFQIRNWNFDWQGDYTYRQPVFLPQGTEISMIYTYDNSTNNPRNPHHPPQRVKYGVNSSDEMGELWLQVLPRGSNALAILENDQKPRIFSSVIDYNTYVLGTDPDNARAHTELGRAKLFLGRRDEALVHLRRAVELQPDADDAHYALGLLFRMQNQLGEAKAAFQAALRSNPDHYKAWGNLGLMLLDEGNADEARLHFEQALRINPEDTIARESLEQIARMGK